MPVRFVKGCMNIFGHSRKCAPLVSLSLLILATACISESESPATAGIGQNAYIALTLERASSQTLVFTDVTVVDPTDGALQRDMNVVVREGRIAAVGRDSIDDVPPDAIHIDGKGRFLIPGLWDSHAHLSYPGECALPLMIAHGVTSVRDLGGPPLQGIEWRREIAEGRRIGPRLFLAGLNIESASWLGAVERIVREQSPDSAEQRLRKLWGDSPRFTVDGENDAKSAVDTAQHMRMDVVKFRNLASKTFHAVAKFTRRAGMPLAGHSPSEISLADAAESGLRSLEHHSNLGSLAELSPGERKKEYARIVRTGMFITPTLVSGGMWAPDSLVLATLADTAGAYDTRRRTLSRSQAAMWQDAIRDRRAWSKPVPRHVHDSTVASETAWVSEAYRAGVLILAGTDVGTLLTYPGSSLHQELALLVEGAGLSKLDAFRSATIYPARFFGIEQEMGTISREKRADLVLLRANPLENIRNVASIEGVVAAGRYYGPDDLAALKACKATGP